MFTMTLRDALLIQERHIKHYGPRYPGGEDALRIAVAARTRIDGQDIDAVRTVVEVNTMVPRGGDIENMVHIADQGGA